MKEPEVAAPELVRCYLPSGAVWKPDSNSIRAQATHGLFGFLDRLLHFWHQRQLSPELITLTNEGGRFELDIISEDFEPVLNIVLNDKRPNLIWQLIDDDQAVPALLVAIGLYEWYGPTVRIMSGSGGTVVDSAWDKAFTCFRSITGYWPHEPRIGMMKAWDDESKQFKLGIGANSGETDVALMNAGATLADFPTSRVAAGAAGSAERRRQLSAALDFGELEIAQQEAADLDVSEDEGVFLAPPSSAEIKRLPTTEEIAEVEVEAEAEPEPMESGPSLQEQVSELASVVQRLEDNFQNLPQLNPIDLYVEFDDRPAGVVGGYQHAAFTDALDILKLERMLLLSGPTGGGKSFLARQLAQALVQPVYSLEYAMGLDQRQYAEAEQTLLHAYVHGGIILMEDVTLICNSLQQRLLMLLESETYTRPGLDPQTFTRHADFFLIATQRPHKYDNHHHALLDRFKLATVEVMYDMDLETALLPDIKVLSHLQQLRFKLEKWAPEPDAILRLSTRTLAAVARQLEYEVPFAKILQHLATGWPKQAIDALFTLDEKELPLDYRSPITKSAEKRRLAREKKAGHVAHSHESPALSAEQQHHIINELLANTAPRETSYSTGAPEVLDGSVSTSTPLA